MAIDNGQQPPIALKLMSHLSDSISFAKFREAIASNETATRMGSGSHQSPIYRSDDQIFKLDSDQVHRNQARLARISDWSLSAWLKMTKIGFTSPVIAKSPLPMLKTNKSVNFARKSERQCGNICATILAYIYSVSDPWPHRCGNAGFGVPGTIFGGLIRCFEAIMGGGHSARVN